MLAIVIITYHKKVGIFWSRMVIKVVKHLSGNQEQKPAVDILSRQVVIGESDVSQCVVEPSSYIAHLSCASSN